MCQTSSWADWNPATLPHLDCFCRVYVFWGKKNFFICCRCHSSLLHWSNLHIWHLAIPAWNHESVKMKVAQSCLTLCDTMECVHIVHGILQARTLEWVTFPFSRGFLQPKDWTHVSGLAGRCFTSWATREITVLDKLKVYWIINFWGVNMSDKMKETYDYTE